MNELISSKEALDVLSRYAPRTWCKRLLLQLIFEQHLSAYFLRGDWQGMLPIGVLLDDDKLVPADGEPFWQAVAEKWGPIATKSMADTVKGRTGLCLAKVTGGRWYENSEHNAIATSFGYFFNAESLDFETGTLQIGEFFPFETIQEFFDDNDPMFQFEKRIGTSLFSWFICKVDLGAMAFEASAIELIAGLEKKGNLSGARNTGRPTKWDWEGALLAVIALANTPDGISSGRGEQARIEEAMADWFVEATGDQPHKSQIREHASRVMAYLAEKS